MSAGQINTQAGPRAERIIDGDNWHVQINLDAVADTLLDQIGAVMYRQRVTWMLSMIGNPKTGAAERARIRATLKAALVGAFEVPLYPHQSEELQADLLEATVEPSWCGCAEAYATRADGYCDGCGNRADMADAGIAQLRAV